MNTRHALVLLAVLLACVPAGDLVRAQNSTRKIRPEPSELALRAGSAIAWRHDVDGALAESAATGRPLLWYVPTVAGSPMDRKDVIDRYMRGGPFSWPRVVARVASGWIALDAVPSRDQAQRFSLRPREFIEPGLVAFDASGRELWRVDEITTLHPAWFDALLARDGAPDATQATTAPAATAASAVYPGHAARADCDAVYRAPDGEAAQRVLASLAGRADSAADRSAAADARAAELRFLHGAGLFHAGREAEANAAWQRLAADLPEQPLAWKAALEADGQGPLVRGFESYEPLPAGAWRFDEHGTRAAPGVWDEPALWRAGTAFLLRMQRADGAFVDSTYDFGGTDSLPNVHSAVTAIAAIALLESARRAPDPRVEAALERAVRHLTSADAIAAEDRDEIVWAHLYGIRLWCRWLDLRPAGADAVRKHLSAAVEALAALQPDSGAWFHEYANPFVIASSLLALKAAERHAVTPAALDRVVERGVRALLQCRTKDGAFSYGWSARGAVRAAVEGGAGRMPLGEHALLSWGRDATLAAAIDASFRHDSHLHEVRKYDDHASRHGYGGFFFWYDLHVRNEAILALAPGDDRDAAAQKQRAQILALPEFDGCFVDSHELGRCYGTAMALWCLAGLDGAGR